MPNWVMAVIGLAFAAILIVVAIRFADSSQGGSVDVTGLGGVVVDPVQPANSPADHRRNAYADSPM